MEPDWDLEDEYALVLARYGMRLSVAQIIGLVNHDITPEELDHLLSRSLDKLS